MVGQLSSDQQDTPADGAHPEDEPGSGRSTGAWAENAKANIRYIRAKQKAITARHRSAEGCPAGSAASGMSLHEIQVTCRSVGRLLDSASKAAHGTDPKYRPLREWWSGACAEAAYKNIHYAEAALARLYCPSEVKSEVLDAVRRARAALSQDDLGRQALLMKVAAGDPVPCTADELSEIIAVGHEAADRNRSRLRTFRNLLLAAFVLTGMLLVLFVTLTMWKPWLVPLCFVHDPSPVDPSDVPWHVCPSGEGHRRQPAQADVFIVAVLGLIGGIVSSGVFVRGLYGNSRPYDVSVPLALLKVPVGGFAAVIGAMLLAGDFVPGFSAVDKQSQILAYALLFGFSQQLLTKMLDDRAEALVASVPTKAERGDASTPRTDDLEALNLLASRRTTNGRRPDTNTSLPVGAVNSGGRDLPVE